MYISKTIIRGSEETLRWELQGRLPAGKIFFTAKRDYSLTGDRLIDLQCSSSYDSAADRTTITVIVPSAATRNIQYDLVYDVTLETVPDTTEITLIRGNLRVKFDVRTPFDQTLTDPEKYIPVKRSDYTDGQFIKAVEINGLIEFQGYTSLKNGLFDVDADGNLMPKESVDIDDIYELDTNGDIMPRDII